MRMKSAGARTAAVVVVILLSASGAAFPGQMFVGFHGGPSIPNLRGGTNEVSEGYTSRLGPCFGVFADYELRPNLFLRGEINCMSEGGKRNGMQPIAPDPSLPVPPGTTLYAAFDNEAILDYIEIPLLAKMSWGDVIRFFADAGPYV